MIDSEGTWFDPIAPDEVDRTPVIISLPDAEVLIPDARRPTASGETPVVRTVLRATWRQPVGRHHEVKTSLAAVLEFRQKDSDE